MDRAGLPFHLARDTAPARLRRGVRAVAMALLAMLTINLGCAWKGDAADTAINHSEGAWRPVPVDLRILRSTRILNEGDRRQLETAVEFRDDMGHPVKAVGTLRITLQPRADTFGQITRPVETWTFNLLTREDQQEWYDAITRGYRFVRPLSPDAPPRDRLRLDARFTTTDGHRLADRFDFASPSRSR